jgi:hypothetical protein
MIILQSREAAGFSRRIRELRLNREIIATLIFTAAIIFVSALGPAAIGLKRANAGVIASSTFDTDLDGWSGAPGTGPSVFTWQSSGGNPGGFVKFDNNAAGVVNGRIIAPSKFLGNWLALGVSRINYDVKIFQTGTFQLPVAPYRIFISGPGGAANFSGPNPGTNPPPIWVNIDAPVEPAAWTVTSGSWDTLVTNVTRLEITVAFYTNLTSFEITGLDNVALFGDADNGEGGVVVTNPNNGHRYEIVFHPGITWTEANNAANARAGNWHLATITSEEENTFIKNLLTAGGSPFFEDACLTSNLVGRVCGGMWLGGTSSSNTAQDWGWVTGEPFSFTNWGPFEPFGNGDRLRIDEFRDRGGLIAWNDAPSNSTRSMGYIVESDSNPRFITFKFEGNVAFVDPVLSTIFDTTQTISGSYTFDSSTAPTTITSPPGVNVSFYFPALTKGDVTIGNHKFNFNPSGFSNDISVGDPFPTEAWQEYRVEGSFTGSVGNFLARNAVVITLRDETSTAFSSTSLPLTPPDLFKFNSGPWHFALGFENSLTGENAGIGVLATITSLTLVEAENSAPVAQAGPDQTVFVGDTVQLNGSGSTDVDGNLLTFQWSVISAPAGSAAALSNATLVNPTFVADLPGTYVVQLVVNDGTVNSSPDTLTITGTTVQNAAAQTLLDAVDTINALDTATLKNRQLLKPLKNKIAEVLAAIVKGRFAGVLDKLEHDILDKTNGCAEIGAPDRNDWIQDCVAQRQVYPLIIQAIDLVRRLR